MALRTIIITASRNQTLSTVIINRGPAGADGTGGGGISTIAEAEDVATVDLPTLNGPLGTALDGKAPLSHTHTVSDITDFPTLATVATSGAYADLTGAPSLVVNFGDLGDATTVDLPTLNGPLGTALGLKTNSADLGTAAYQDADQNLQTTDDVYFNSVNSTGRLGLNSAPSYGGAVSISGAFNQLSTTGQVAMMINNSATNLRATGLVVRAGVNSYQSSSLYCTSRNNVPILLAHGNGNVGIGISESDYPAEKLEVAGNIKSSGTIQPGTYTVATLPSGVAGMRATVSDSDKHAQGNFGNTVVAAGAGTSYVVPVFFDGTNWIIA